MSHKNVGMRAERSIDSKGKLERCVLSLDKRSQREVSSLPEISKNLLGN